MNRNFIIHWHSIISMYGKSLNSSFDLNKERYYIICRCLIEACWCDKDTMSYVYCFSKLLILYCKPLSPFFFFFLLIRTKIIFKFHESKIHVRGFIFFSLNCIPLKYCRITMIFIICYRKKYRWPTANKKTHILIWH